ncbi:MAG: hypothetical protein CM15mV76_400 [uncultured marine virus]|nr:MAG: hypothetical protein CM15mV76_400 [uncultured marine virus]
MNDIDSLSVMEEVYEARKLLKMLTQECKFVSGVGFGFFENNTVLDPINQKPKNLNLSDKILDFEQPNEDVIENYEEFDYLTDFYLPFRDQKG